MAEVGRQRRKGATVDQLLVEKLKQRKEELEQIVRQKSVAVKKAPGGYLKSTRRKNSLEYYWKAPGSTRYSYISEENRKIAESLAQRDYDKMVLRCAKKELKLIKKILKNCRINEIDAVYEECSSGRKVLIKPVRPSDEEFREAWRKQESCTGGFDEGDPEFYTARGERVRSKTEVLIANFLYNLGVDYLYECQIMLPGYGTARPDFTILDIKNRRTIVWEHLGKMDDPKYAAKNIQKINGYLKKGYIIGETLILTFETERQPISTAQIEELVKHYFL